MLLKPFPELFAGGCGLQSWQRCPPPGCTAGSRQLFLAPGDGWRRLFAAWGILAFGTINPSVLQVPGAPTQAGILLAEDTSVNNHSGKKKTNTTAAEAPCACNALPVPIHHRAATHCLVAHTHQLLPFQSHAARCTTACSAAAAGRSPGREGHAPAQAVTWPRHHISTPVCTNLVSLVQVDLAKKRAIAPAQEMLCKVLAKELQRLTESCSQTGGVAEEKAQRPVEAQGLRGEAHVSIPPNGEQGFAGRGCHTTTIQMPMEHMRTSQLFSNPD